MSDKRVKIDAESYITKYRDRDCDWFANNRESLAHQYDHSIVLVYNEQVIGKGFTLEAALQDAENSVTDDNIIIPVIAFLSPVSPSMNKDVFWRLIEETHNNSDGYMEKQVPLLVSLLKEQSVEAIMEFELIFTHLFWKAYIAELWDAADLIGCGCSDDGFYDFRSWLIGQGKEVYEKALVDPESLAEMLEPRHRDEVADGRLAYASWEAYELKTGHEMPIGLLAPYDAGVAQLVGTHKNEQAETNFPSILAKLGSCKDWLDTLYGK